MPHAERDDQKSCVHQGGQPRLFPDLASCLLMSPQSEGWPRTEKHAQLLLTSDSRHELHLVAAGQMDALHLKVLAQKLPRPQRRRRHLPAAASAAAGCPAGIAAIRCGSDTAQARRAAGGDSAGSAAAHSRGDGLVQALMHIEVRQEACGPKRTATAAAHHSAGAMRAPTAPATSLLWRQMLQRGVKTLTGSACPKMPQSMRGTDLRGRCRRLHPPSATPHPHARFDRALHPVRRAHNIY